MFGVSGHVRLELERGLEFFFFQKIETNYHSFSSCIFWVAPLFLMLKENV